MTFQNPSVLPALIAAGIPIILHLMSLRRPRRLPFSDVRLLAEIQSRAMPRSRLRSILLAASRSLLLALLILAYAGPGLDAPRGASGAGGLSLAVLMDASYSMGYRTGGKTRFELLRSQGLELLASLGPGDRVAFSAFSDGEILPEGGLDFKSPAEAAAKLRAAELSGRGTNIGAALKAASDALSAAPGRRVVLVLTDGARHGFRSPLPSTSAGTLILGSAWKDSASNAYIRSARAAPGSGAAKPRLAVEAALSGGRERSSAIDLWSGPARSAGLALRLSPGGVTASEFALPSPRRGSAAAWSGRIVLRPDNLAADDEYFYSMGHPVRPKVLVLHGTPAFFGPLSGGYFLREFLGGRGESLAPADAEFLDLGRWEEADLSSYKAVALADFRAVDRRAAAALESFVRAGGGLWLLPGERTSPESLQALAPWLPATVGPAFDSPRPYGILAEGWDLGGFDLDRVAVARLLRLSPKAGASVPLKGGDGSPLLVLGSWGAGRVAVWASTLDAGSTNLGIKPVFAALVRRILDETVPPSPEAARELNLPLGRPLVRIWSPAEAAPASVQVRAPDGKTANLAVKGRRVEFPATTAAGLYRLSWDALGHGRGEVGEVYAVNLDRSAESDPAPEPSPPWRTLDAERLAAEFRGAVYGRALGPWFMAAAFAFLVLEMYLALPWRLEASPPPRAPARPPAGVAAMAILIMGASVAGAEQPPAGANAAGDRFVWTQLRLGPSWDPYPGAAADALDFLSAATSVLVQPGRREIPPTDPLLFESPLVILAGRQAPPNLDENSTRALRQYLLSGGMLWIEDVSGAVSSPFDRWVRRIVPALLPEAELKPLPPDHVVYKTFFLLRGPSGRVQVQGALEGVDWGGRTAVVYSRNDALGAWAKDALGRPLMPCLPGGEPQRYAAKKLTLNILMYSLTGNYKDDAVHQPFLLQKLKGPH